MYIFLRSKCCNDWRLWRLMSNCRFKYYTVFSLVTADTTLPNFREIIKIYICIFLNKFLQVCDWHLVDRTLRVSNYWLKTIGIIVYRTNFSTNRLEFLHFLISAIWFFFSLLFYYNYHLLISDSLKQIRCFCQEGARVG